MSGAGKYLIQLSKKLFVSPEEQAQFIEAVLKPGRNNQAAVWLRNRPDELPARIDPLPWQPEFVDRLQDGHRLGESEAHARGDLYLLDFSSVFAASVLLAVSGGLRKVLDLCAAPGGKSAFAWRALRPKLLVSNETIGKRLPALISNMKRCLISPVLVTNEDPEPIAEKGSSAFDLVVADAPCSGQSLLVKGQPSPGCFHPATVNMNSNRQKRILANAGKTVAAGGYLAYMTCTYSPDENEKVISWFLKKFPDFQTVEVPFLKDYRSHLTEIFCYRLWPQSGIGAGSFTCLLQKTIDEESVGESAEFNPENLRVVWQNSTAADR